MYDLQLYIQLLFWNTLLRTKVGGCLKKVGVVNTDIKI